jgi:hypothetical protein
VRALQPSNVGLPHLGSSFRSICSSVGRKRGVVHASWGWARPLDFSFAETAPTCFESFEAHTNRRSCSPSPVDDDSQPASHRHKTRFSLTHGTTIIHLPVANLHGCATATVQDIMQDGPSLQPERSQLPA